MAIGKTRLHRLAKNLANLKRTETRIWLKAANVADVKNLIIRLNTEVQLGQLNVDSLGVRLSDIGGDYSPVTLQIAKEKGRPKRGSSDIDLHDTGDFWESFVVKIDAKGITISADTIKDGEDLRDDWGENIIGLTKESLEEVTKKILENYRKELKRSLFL